MKLLLILCLCTSTVFAAGNDTIHQRDLERQTKAEQARALNKRLVLRDFGQQPAPLAVDAYQFDLKIIPNEAKVIGLVTLDLVAIEALAELSLDAVGLEVSKVWFTDSAGVKSDALFGVQPETIRVTLPAKIAAGGKFSVTVAYSVRGDRRDGRATEVDRGIFFVNGDGALSDVTPTVYTSVEPQLARTWFPCIDDPSIKAKRSRMRVSVPDGWYAVSNGALRNIVSHPETRTATFEWDHAFPVPTYLISLAIAPYTVIQDAWRDTPVQYFVPKNLADKARHDFERTPRMIEEFSKLWSPYPFEKYAMATVPYYGGAMEHTTATTMSDGHVSGDRESEDTVAHELAHHWWGNIVTLASWDDLWLNEGFATYGETLFAEKFEGRDKALEYMLWNRGSYFRFDPRGEHAVVDTELSPDDKFSPAVYEKGAWILHMLRALLGDESFFAAQSAYLKKFAYSNASTSDLKTVLEQVSHRDLGPFFSQWVYRKGYPELAIEWSYDQASRTVEVIVGQEAARLYQFPLELAVAGRAEAGKDLTTLSMVCELRQARQACKQALPVGFPEPEGILVDPELKILKKTRVGRSVAELRFWLEAGASKDWLAKLDVVDGLTAETTTLEIVRLLSARAMVEKSKVVRAELFDALAEARKTKGLTDEDVQKIQAVLVTGLADESVDVRLEAAVAAKQYLSPELSDTIAARFEQEPSARVRAGLALTLAHARHPRAFELFYLQLQKVRGEASSRKLMQALLESFGKLGDPRGAAILVEYVNGSNPFLNKVALESLGSLGVPETFQLIVDILRDLRRTTELRVASTRALANYGGIVAAKALSDQLKVEENPEVIAAIKAALAQLGGQPNFRNLRLQGSPASLQW